MKTDNHQADRFGGKQFWVLKEKGEDYSHPLTMGQIVEQETEKEEKAKSDIKSKISLALSRAIDWLNGTSENNPYMELVDLRDEIEELWFKQPSGEAKDISPLIQQIANNLQSRDETIIRLQARIKELEGSDNQEEQEKLFEEVIEIWNSNHVGIAYRKMQDTFKIFRIK